MKSNIAAEPVIPDTISHSMKSSGMIEDISSLSKFAPRADFLRIL